MIIASHIEGRLRVRDPRLRESRLIDTFREQLLERTDVRDVSFNAKVGSVLILYRHTQKSVQAILTFVSAFFDCAAPLPKRVPSSPASKPSKKTQRPLLSHRRIVNLGMLVSLLVSLVASAGSKQLHILAGLIFLGIAATHMFDKRATFFA